MKDYRDKEMKYLLIVYALLFVLWCTGDYKTMWGSMSESYKAILELLAGAIISGAISLVVYIFDSIYTSNLKDILVNLGFLHRSGEVIFTKIKNGTLIDNRFTLNNAKELYKSIIADIPEDKKERFAYENSNWYIIYTQYADKGSVTQAQKDYLICRDLYIETINFIILYFIAIAISNKVTFSLKYIGILFAMAIATNIAAHIKNSRFVNNVIAFDIASRAHVHTP